LLKDNLTAALVEKKVLIFDFDGTLANTSELHAAAFSKVLGSFGIAVDYQNIAGMNTLDAIQKCLIENSVELDPEGVDDLVLKKQDSVRNMIKESLEPIAGVREFLVWANKRFKLALVTSGSRATVCVALEKLKFNDLFELMIFSEDVKNSKPSPDGFLLAAKHYDVESKCCLVFEDSKAGIDAAIGANMQVVDVSDGWQQLIFCNEENK
jgi:HAD superfamily hydrolase (TIGR01509 family)